MVGIIQHYSSMIEYTQYFGWDARRWRSTSSLPLSLSLPLNAPPEQPPCLDPPPIVRPHGECFACAALPFWDILWADTQTGSTARLRTYRFLPGVAPGRWQPMLQAARTMGGLGYAEPPHPAHIQAGPLV